MGWVYLAIGIFLVAAGTAVVWKYNSAIERAVAAEQRADVAEEGLKAYALSYNKLLGDYKNLDKTLQAKTQADKKIRKELDNVQAQLEELKRSIPAVKEWADTTVPEPVVKLLQQPVDTPPNQGNTNGDPAKGSDRADPRSDGGKITIRAN